MFDQGKASIAALIAFAGVGVGSLSLYLGSRWLLANPRICRHPRLFLLSFWLCFMAIGNFYDYVPIRTLAWHGDMAYIALGLHLSPWLIVIGLGYPTFWAMWHFFFRILPDAFEKLSIDSPVQRVAQVVLCAFIMFVYFGASGFFGYGDVPHAFSGLSMLFFPIVVALCWPAQKRVTGESYSTPPLTSKAPSS
jgi:hypothetical protein